MSVTELAPDRAARDAQIPFVRGNSSSPGHTLSGAHDDRAGRTPSVDHAPDDAQATTVGGKLSGDQAAHEAQSLAVAAELQFCAAFLDDIEGVRIATENRIRALTDEGVDAAPYQPQLEALKAVEHDATLRLQRVIRRHPLGPWIKATIGVGEKQGARLIASLDNPAWNYAEDRPRRGPAELWAYCGFVPGQKRRKGVKSNWNPDAKMRAFLIAESCLKAKARSKYGPVYDRERRKWEGRDTSDGHKHNHALRVVAKEVLKDLFLESQRVGMAG